MHLDFRWKGWPGFLFLLWGCGQAPEDTQFLAQVGDVRISVDDLRNYARNSRIEGEVSGVQYRDLLQTLIDREVLLVEARLQGVDEDSLVLSRLREHEEQRLLEEMLHR